MKIVRLIKPVLFLYEFLRIMILSLVLLMSTNENELLGQLVFLAPNALFPLMALFIWINQLRYSAYLPLYAAGKCIVICTSLVWSILSGQVTIIGRLFGSDFVFIICDLLAVTAVLSIYRDNKKSAEINIDIEERKNICE